MAPRRKPASVTTTGDIIPPSSDEAVQQEDLGGIVSLNPDLLKAANEALDKIAMVYSQIRGEIKDNQLREGMRGTYLGLLEHCVHNLGLAVGYEGDLHEEMTERYAKIRAANDRIHMLESQLGKTNDPSTLDKTLSLMGKVFDYRLRKLGFHASFGTRDGEKRPAFMPIYNGAWFSSSVSLGIHKDKFFREGPLKDQEDYAAYIVQSQREGLTLLDSPQGGTYDILDCGQSRAWIIDKLTAAFPSLSIELWRSQAFCGDRESTALHTRYVISSVDVRIDDLTDLVFSEEENEEREEASKEREAARRASASK